MTDTQPGKGLNSKGQMTKGTTPVRYAYAITSALLIGGASAALVLQNPAGAQTAQNEPGAIQAAAPRSAICSAGSRAAVAVRSRARPNRLARAF